MTICGKCNDFGRTSNGCTCGRDDTTYSLPPTRYETVWKSPKIFICKKCKNDFFTLKDREAHCICGESYSLDHIAKWNF